MIGDAQNKNPPSVATSPIKQQPDKQEPLTTSSAPAGHEEDFSLSLATGTEQVKVTVDSTSDIISNKHESPSIKDDELEHHKKNISVEREADEFDDDMSSIIDELETIEEPMTSDEKPVLTTTSLQANNTHNRVLQVLQQAQEKNPTSENMKEKPPTPAIPEPDKTAVPKTREESKQDKSVSTQQPTPNHTLQPDTATTNPENENGPKRGLGNR